MELLPHLLPDPTALVVDDAHVDPENQHLDLMLSATATQAHCPCCGHATTRIHSRYTRMLADLQFLAVHAQDAAQRLLVPADIDGDAPHLTPREIDILRLTRDGKSAWVAGQILAISEHTVNFHLRNIQRKLNTTSKHQAVLVAMRHGLI